VATEEEDTEVMAESVEVKETTADAVPPKEAEQSQN
jgi:hypothetical protein